MPKNSPASVYDLKSKVALVTGASRGIGAAIATRLAAAGARVIVHYGRSEAAAHAVATGIKTAGGEARVLQAELAEVKAIKPLLTAAAAAFGQLDILVNNAGVFAMGEVQSMLDAQHYETVFATNVRAPLLTSAEAARLFIAQGRGGRIINISSVAASGANRGASVYAASKAALEAMTRVHAGDLGPHGITVNAVAPGVTESDMLRSGLAPEYIDASIAKTPLGRLGAPEDIAEVVAFLASDAARWVTGEVITASGGLRR